MNQSEPGVYEVQELLDNPLETHVRMERTVCLARGLTYVEALSCVSAIAGHWEIPAYLQPETSPSRTWSVFVPSGASYGDICDAWRCISEDDPRRGPFRDWALVFPEEGNTVHLIYSSPDKPLNYHGAKGPFGDSKDYL